MRTVTKVLFVVVLVCLLLPLAAGNRRPLHGKRRGHHHRLVTVRLRRSGTNHPANHPVRPAPAAVLPPDEDEDFDRLRFAHEDVAAFAFAPPERLSLTPFFATPSAWPSAPARPLYRTLCLLLI